MKPPGGLPYCSLALIVVAFTCQLIVYFGNMYTADSMSALGRSSNGWSEIGLTLGHSIAGEFDRQLDAVASDLTTAVSAVVEMKGIMGGAVPLLVQSEDEDSSQSFDEKVQVTALLVEKVAQLVGALKPVLSQVVHWQTSMGENVLSKIQDFTGTLDKAQKIFDLAMGYLDDTDNGEDDMFHDTFLLFDVSNNGHITLDDLHSVAEMYSVSALSGFKAEELMQRYDLDRDHFLNRAEYRELVGDESLPSIMSVVLRSYASGLLNIAGSVGNARTREEVAHGVVDYLQLVCNKNMTKVSWVADALTNGSLPLAFTADVMAQLAADPERADTGALVVGQMVNFGPDRVASAVELMATASFWQASGLDAEGQAQAVEQVARWATEGLDSPGLPAMVQIFGSPASNCSSSHCLIDLGIDELSDLSNLMQIPRSRFVTHRGASSRRDASTLQIDLGIDRAASQNAQARELPALARQFAERGAHQRAALLKTERALQCDVTLSQARAHSALTRLLGNEHFSQFLANVFVADPDVAQVVNAGVPAKQETLQFAEWLSNNATATARMLAKQCFKYTSQSSGTLESIGSRVSGMLKGMQLATSALQTLSSAHQNGNMEGAFLNFSMALLASIEDNRQLSEASSQAVRRAVAAISNITSNNTIPEAEMAREMLLDMHERLHAQVAGHARAVAPLLPSNRSVILFHAAWERISPFVNTLQDFIPSNVVSIRSSRRDVGQTTAGITTLFSVFQESGPLLFEGAAAQYRRTWTKYILINSVLTLWSIFFVLWASGFFMTRRLAMHPGVSNAIGAQDEDPPPPTTFWQKCRVTLEGICFGFLTSADNFMLFWSLLLLTECILLFSLATTAAISLFFGIRLVLASGCAELYILGSNVVCREMLMTVSEWLSTFTHIGGEPLENACQTQSLLTCDVISSNLSRALAFSFFASLMAVLLSWLVIVDSAVANETVRWQLSQLEDESSKEKEEKHDLDDEEKGEDVN